ncbi:2,3-dihydro-2,3-dihydroxybenzoate dehydrogenase [Streptomyces sp. SID4919]|uniref:2,3-dihydro-2,3-dihydroxybenzoate dehydrogenase n=1 Tax=unclassified Streptomyces TaxID=2593676 RepID=UPI0008239261|nr:MULTISPECIES: 2,3-dihydro-2,3-dihydroxybenzoate dehydrogenase [unclassified Streptomyces]MYY08552.1 2,3-dihydro-2,3-dihydroxybenzoate dehydrogenase [Streptomyces sp. SID4919]SCK54957.1 2,3-dihydro-2,3-dihydroxybenzoate dehydrogenase [Streptomyces sp. AmelKG-E11A]
MFARDGGNAGSVALVTGAARGIGAAVVDGLVREGATVAAVDIDADGLKDLAERSGGRVVPFTADVADPAAVADVVDRTERDIGPIVTGVSVAGILRPAPLCETTDEDWADTFSVNTTGAFLVLRELARRMVPRGRGSLVTVGSNASGVPRTGMGAYAASKAATTMLTRCLGLEVARHGIRCNVVSPGSTDTPMQRLLWTDEGDLARVIAGTPEQFRVGIPLGRIAEPADIADAVLFLVSDRARHITMQNLFVDGGATLRA